MTPRFDAHQVALELIRALAPILDAVARRDRDLAQQLRRSASSVPLNVCEGSQRRGADRSQFYRIAAGSASETRAALEVAAAWGYVDVASLTTVQHLLDRVIAMLWRLTHGRGS